jgi:hypothetical protein
MATVSDHRYGVNAEVMRRISHNALSARLSVSTERDYNSVGGALGDAIDFNDKNTILGLGVAYTYDYVDMFFTDGAKPKRSMDEIIGLTQTLDPQTVLVCNLSLGQMNGFLSDPYRVVELNGELVSEKRPDTKNREIFFTSLSHYVKLLRGSGELSYRLYHDSYGITAHTEELDWYQEIGAHFVIRPMVRFYNQTEASFYDVSFQGSPDAYSSDYRISALKSLGYGLKLVWNPTDRFSMDVAYERYELRGTDGKTVQEMYPSANVVILGVRLWF